MLVVDQPRDREDDVGERVAGGPGEGALAVKAAEADRSGRGAHRGRP